MPSVCIIDGKEYDVSIIDIEESFSVLYTENTGRVIGDGEMILDPIGTFFTHKVSFDYRKDKLGELDSLWDFLSVPRKEGFQVEIVSNQSSMSYKAYVSNGSRKLLKIDRKSWKIYWNVFTINFIPIKAQKKVT